MSKTGFGQMYRQLSSKLLDLVVTLLHVLGEVPTESTITEQNTTDSNTVICYVLQNYSRSNALVVDGDSPSASKTSFRCNEFLVIIKKKLCSIFTSK